MDAVGLIFAPEMLYCLNPDCPHPSNPAGNLHCQYCGQPITLRNRFKASRLLGQGGFGQTYLAQDLDNRNKPCVIKRLTYKGPDDYSTEKARQLFEQEAERLDQLVHPQIPRLLAYFQEGSYLYLVQEVIEGQTLRDELQADGPFTEAKIRGVLTGLLPVLQFVHSRNVIHRDIKPDNIMRKRSGELVLIDFGVAKLLEESGFSRSTTTIGTPGYAAPEQIQGRVRPASDLFALGATCFQLLSQGFDTDDGLTTGYGWINQWRRYVKQPISDNFAAILTRLIALEECDRYGTAMTVMQDLQTPSTSITPSASESLTSSSAAPLSQISTVAVSPVAPLGLLSPTAPSLSPLANLASENLAPAARSQKGSSDGAIAAPPLKKVPVSGGFWLTYGFRSYVSHAVSFLIAVVAIAAAVAFQQLEVASLSSEQMQPALRLVFWLHWPVAGVFVGLAQWMMIKQWLPRALWWLPATVAGFWAIALAIGSSYTDILSGIVCGLVLGLCQWAAMRQQAPRAGWWVLWTMLSLAVLFQSFSLGYLRVLGWFAIAPLLDGLLLWWILGRQVDRQQAV
ncbi:MAG: serine/threonine-protein kinase [Phormidesmis sp.]